MIHVVSIFATILPLKIYDISAFMWIERFLWLFGGFLGFILRMLISLELF